QPGLREALLGQRIRNGLAGELAQQLGLGAPGLVHGRWLCQIGAMSLAVKSRRKKTKEPAARPAPDPALLLQWYDRHRRVLPWRARAGEAADPSRVWPSDSMRRPSTVQPAAPVY